MKRMINVIKSERFDSIWRRSRCLFHCSPLQTAYALSPNGNNQRFFVGLLLLSHLLHSHGMFFEQVLCYVGTKWIDKKKTIKLYADRHNSAFSFSSFSLIPILYHFFVILFYLVDFEVWYEMIRNELYLSSVKVKEKNERRFR